MYTKQQLLNMLEQVKQFEKEPCEEGLSAAIVAVEQEKLPNVQDAIWLAYQAETTSEMLDALYTLYVDTDDIHDKNYIVRETVVAHPNASEELLIKGASDPHITIPLNVAARRDAPAEALRLCARDERIVVKRRAAANPNTPLEELLNLLHDGEANRHLARNPAITRHIIDALVDSLDAWVWVHLTRNKATPLDVLWHIAKEAGTIRVIGGMDKHPNATPELVRYVKDKVSTIAFREFHGDDATL